MNNKKNLISAIFLQIITIISGLILPRMIIITFGSEVNGLISSVTQFLSFISLLEGGLGAVVLAELYKPIEEKDDLKIKEILVECQNFFKKISAIFCVYILTLILVYPLFCKTDRSFMYVSSLIIILGISTLIRYLFAITNKLYLQANQKLYIVNIVSAIVILLNLFFAYIIIKFLPEIHLIKIVADLVFVIQPIIFNYFVDKKYRVVLDLKTKKKDNTVLKNRWSGFAQNLAYFINMNTDVVVTTIFIGLKEVSIYTTYMLAINALRTFIALISNSYQSVWGKYYAANDIKNLKEKFCRLESVNLLLSLILYSTCLLLVNPFVKIYTQGVNDANYFQPMFILIMILANLIYSVREPQRYLVLAIGKFNETNISAFVEAFLNIAISIILSFKFGLIGIAIGTLIAVTYRYLFFIYYLHNNIVNLNLRRYIKQILFLTVVISLNVFVYYKYNFMFDIHDLFKFCLFGFLIVLIECIIIISIYILFNLNNISKLNLKNIKNRR